MGDDYDYSNITDDFFDYDDFENPVSVIYVLTCIIIGIGLPLTLVAIGFLCCLVRNDHVAPIYIINLLISDLIQFICMIVEVAQPEDSNINDIFFFFYKYSQAASVYFMVCVALERYLLIAHPRLKCFRRTNIIFLICVGFWLFSFVPVGFRNYPQVVAVLLLLPLPLFISFLGGTLKALSASRLPSDEKCRIVGIVVLVLLIYTLLFLPSIIRLLGSAIHNETLFNLSLICVKLSPLADLVLYVFVRKGTIDKLLASVCCCRMDSSDVDTSTV